MQWRQIDFEAGEIRLDPGTEEQGGARLPDKRRPPADPRGTEGDQEGRREAGVHAEGPADRVDAQGVQGGVQGVRRRRPHPDPISVLPAPQIDNGEFPLVRTTSPNGRSRSSGRLSQSSTVARARRTFTSVGAGERPRRLHATHRARAPPMSGDRSNWQRTVPIAGRARCRVSNRSASVLVEVVESRCSFGIGNSRTTHATAFLSTAHGAGQAAPIAFAVSSVEPWNDFRRSLWVTSTLGGSVSPP
jgi:hypothetical protein